MILSDIEYYLTSWSLACTTTHNSIESLYKKALKISDKKLLTFHHCNILVKHEFLSFNHPIHFKQACPIYKVLHRLAPLR